METVEGACIELGDGYSTKKFACNVVCGVSLCGLVWSEAFVWFGVWGLIEEVRLLLDSYMPWVRIRVQNVAIENTKFNKINFFYISLLTVSVSYCIIFFCNFCLD